MQSEISIDMIEQELRPVDCEQRQMDRFKENCNIDSNDGATCRYSKRRRKLFASTYTRGAVAPSSSG